MNLTELKKMPVPELNALAQSMEIEGVGRSRKQDLIFAILKAHAKRGEDIYGDGVLEILSDGFGFLRSADASYLAGPDDIYVSPSQIRRFSPAHRRHHLRQDPPAEGRRALFRAAQGRRDQLRRPENAKNKILFENFTPLFANKSGCTSRSATAAPRT
jgi:transcription termination factor Rho